MNKKWVAIFGLFIGILFLIFAIYLLTSSNHTSQEKAFFKNNPAISQQPYQSYQLEAAIAKQAAADHEYADWQKSVATDYPWMKKLPLATEKYYLYFDLGKNAFIGKIYLKSGDDAEAVKKEVMRILKEDKGVAVEKYSFEWSAISI